MILHLILVQYSLCPPPVDGQAWSPVHLWYHRGGGTEQRITPLNLPVSKWTNHLGGNTMIISHYPSFHTLLFVGSCWCFKVKIMKVFFLYQTPFPGDRALAMAEAEGLGIGSLAQRLRLPWEPAGLGVINNYLIIDFSIPAGFLIGCFCSTSGYERKQYSVMARRDNFFPRGQFLQQEKSFEFTHNMSLAWQQKQNVHLILTNTHELLTLLCS